MPGVVWKPGRNAGNLGNRKQNVRLHYTVGTDSTGIGLKGYFHFLVPKQGTPIQFAPTEAVCWDACEWNPSGYGVEIERLSDAEPLTDSQVLWVGRIAHWANMADGIPLVFRDSPGNRVEPSAGFRGFITHRSLAEHKCDQHYDYITGDDWNRAVGSGAPTPAPPADEDDMATFATFRYGNDARTVQIDDAGNLRQHFWTGKAWATDVIAGPDGHTAVKDKAVQKLGASAVVGAFGQADRIDVFAQGANGKQIHAYWNGKAWASDVVA